MKNGRVEEEDEEEEGVKKKKTVIQDHISSLQMEFAGAVAGNPLPRRLTAATSPEVADHEISLGVFIRSPWGLHF